MLPYFHIDSVASSQTDLQLDEDVSRHVIQVLRMKRKDRIQLTDGKGNLLTTTIVDDHKKKCVVHIDEIRFEPQQSRKITIAISLLKNNSRLEWVFEKITEIGIFEIIPLLCERTERQNFRFDRIKNILISAM